MADIAPCVPCCSSTPLSVNVPGPQGGSTLTATTATFILPAIGGTVLIPVGDTSWMVVGKNLFISDGSKLANFIVTAINAATSFTGRFLGLVGDSASGTVAAAALVVAGLGDFTVPWDLDLLTAFADTSGGAKSDAITSNPVKSTLVIGPFSMALLVNGQVWKVPVPFAFVLSSVTFRCDVAITTGAKAATLTAQINGAPTTNPGGIIAVAGAYASGAIQAGSAIVGANTGTGGLTLEIAVSGVTTFIEGYGHVELSVVNSDLAAVISAIAFKANQLRTALRHQ